MVVGDHVATRVDHDARAQGVRDEAPLLGRAEELLEVALERVGRAARDQRLGGDVDHRRLGLLGRYHHRAAPLGGPGAHRGGEREERGAHQDASGP